MPFLKKTRIDENKAQDKNSTKINRCRINFKDSIVLSLNIFVGSQNTQVRQTTTDMDLTEQTTSYFWSYAVYAEILAEVRSKVPEQKDVNFLTTIGANVNAQSLITTVERIAARQALSPSALALHLTNFYSSKFNLSPKIPTVVFKNQSVAILRLRDSLVSRLNQFSSYRNRVLLLLKKQKLYMSFIDQGSGTLLRLLFLIVIYFVAPFSKSMPEAITFDMFKRFVARYGPLSICMENILSNFFVVEPDTLWNMSVTERSSFAFVPYTRPISVNPTKTKEIIQNFRRQQQTLQERFRRQRDELPFYVQSLTNDILYFKPVFVLAPIDSGSVYEYALFRENTNKDGTVSLDATVKTDIIQFIPKKERDGFASDWEYTISFSDDGKKSLGHSVSPFVAGEQIQASQQYVWSQSLYKARGINKQQAELETYLVLPDVDRVFMPNQQQKTQSHSIPPRTYHSVLFEDEMQRHDLCTNQFHFFFS